MLRVMYEAAELNGTISDWQEDRGLLRVRVARHTTPHQFTESLNETLAHVLASAHWCQYWNGEVISVTSPSNPLRVNFQVSDFDPAPVVEIRERKGLVAVHVSPTANVDEFVHALNPALEELLVGGQWFQHWNGEIVTMDSPTAALT